MQLDIDVSPPACIINGILGAVLMRQSLFCGKISVVVPFTIGNRPFKSIYHKFMVISHKATTSEKSPFDDFNPRQNPANFDR